MTVGDVAVPAADAVVPAAVVVPAAAVPAAVVPAAVVLSAASLLCTPWPSDNPQAARAEKATPTKNMRKARMAATDFNERLSILLGSQLSASASILDIKFLLRACEFIMHLYWYFFRQRSPHNIDVLGEPSHSRERDDQLLFFICQPVSICVRCRGLAATPLVKNATAKTEPERAIRKRRKNPGDCGSAIRAGPNVVLAPAKQAGKLLESSGSKSRCDGAVWSHQSRGGLMSVGADCHVMSTKHNAASRLGSRAAS